MYIYLNIFNSKIFVYDLLNYFAFFAFFLFCFVQLKKVGNHGIYFELLLKKVQSSAKMEFVLVFAEALFFSLFMMAVPNWTVAYPFADLFYDYTGETGAVLYFGHILSSFLFFMLAAFLIGVKPFKMLDLTTPAYPLALTYGKFSCFCAGCCNGIAVDWGFYNYDTQLREFPVQLVESAEALVIFLILMRIRKEVKLGTMFPLYLVFYSGMRFFSEFLRAQPDIFGPFKCAQIFCIAGIILGFLGFVLAEKYAERIDEFFGRIYSKIEQKLGTDF